MMAVAGANIGWCSAQDSNFLVCHFSNYILLIRLHNSSVMSVYYVLYQVPFSIWPLNTKSRSTFVELSDDPLSEIEGSSLLSLRSLLDSNGPRPCCPTLGKGVVITPELRQNICTVCICSRA